MSLMEDREVISEILSGNKNKYRYLVDKYQDMVFRVSVGFVHNKDDADDITQDVFINAFQSLNSFKGESEFSTWLHRIAINASLNHIRKNRRRNIFQKSELPVSYKNPSQILISDIDPDKIADQQLIEKQHIIRVRQAIDSLPKKQRVAFILSRYDEISQQKIAEIMNTSVGAVEQLLWRAKLNLQKQLRTYYENNIL